MASANIPVPSPADIKAGIFPHGVVALPILPRTWRASVLLTPHGRGSDPSPPYADELIAAEVTYEAVTAVKGRMRLRMYLLETLAYYDVFFVTDDGRTQWWWLTSEPSDAVSIPSAAYGPFGTPVQVPASTYLADRGFTHVGSWNVLSRLRNAFAAKATATAKGGTWFWFDAADGTPTRIMNVVSNDFLVPVLGMVYFADFCNFAADASIDLRGIEATCGGAMAASNPGPFVEAADLFVAFKACPPAATKACVFSQVQHLIPGIAPGNTAGTTPPQWTNVVSSQCYMIAQELAPLYCELWYDWTIGVQVTVFVAQDDAGDYTVRFDEILPKGRPGPTVVYAWNGDAWAPACFEAPDPRHGSVPMPVPDFVAAGGGRCRAVIEGNPHFGDISVWSVEMGDAASAADFWYWFDPQQRGVLFSLSPASSLTLIDYQTFVQTKPFESGYLTDRSNEVPACQAQQQSIARARPKFRMK
ncbi:hypothetical protein [Variovorax sp. dw_308]|uniref:hypothetical protein n=1 Tax=Variovorax sp. dw_308 TaxID=2721546 RepID=UPI001C482F59|nr:hypothetical protein [Variovorax sp. dw_308]